MGVLELIHEPFRQNWCRIYSEIQSFFLKIVFFFLRLGYWKFVKKRYRTLAIIGVEILPPLDIFWQQRCKTVLFWNNLGSNINLKDNVFLWVLSARESKWNHNRFWQPAGWLGVEYIVAYSLHVLNQHKKKIKITGVKTIMFELTNISVELSRPTSEAGRKIWDLSMSPFQEESTLIPLMISLIR